jgi:hypothetical protein
MQKTVDDCNIGPRGLAPKLFDDKVVTAVAVLHFQIRQKRFPNIDVARHGLRPGRFCFAYHI